MCEGVSEKSPWRECHTQTRTRDHPENVTCAGSEKSKKYLPHRNHVSSVLEAAKKKETGGIWGTLLCLRRLLRDTASWSEKIGHVVLYALQRRTASTSPRHGSDAAPLLLALLKPHTPYPASFPLRVLLWTPKRHHGSERGVKNGARDAK